MTIKAVRWIVLGLLAGAALLIGYWAIVPNTSPTWTGFAPYDEEADGPRAKTLWDWMKLLVVPVFLAFGAWLLSTLEKQTERNVEADRQRQEVLRQFIQRIGELLLKHRLGASTDGNEVRSIARTISMAAFRVLDPDRKAEALQFLQESGLIYSDPVVSLQGANLRGALLSNASLRGAVIRGAYLTNCALHEANLSDADLTGSDLSGADLSGALLDNANLSFTFMTGACLSDTDLRTANLKGVILDDADLRRALIDSAQYEIVGSLRGARLPGEDRLLARLWMHLKSWPRKGGQQ